MATIVLEGFDKLAAKLSKMSESARGYIAQEAVEEGAAVIQSHAKGNVPVKNGTLRDSIAVEVNKTETGAEAEIGPGVIYGRIQELGGTIRPTNAKALHFKVGNQDVFTKKVVIEGKPYLRPAIENNLSEIKEKMSESIRDNLETFAE